MAATRPRIHLRIPKGHVAATSRARKLLQGREQENVSGWPPRSSEAWGAVPLVTQNGRALSKCRLALDKLQGPHLAWATETISLQSCPRGSPWSCLGDESLRGPGPSEQPPAGHARTPSMQCFPRTALSRLCRPGLRPLSPQKGNALKAGPVVSFTTALQTQERELPDVPLLSECNSEC